MLFFRLKFFIKLKLSFERTAIIRGRGNELKRNYFNDK